MNSARAATSLRLTVEPQGDGWRGLGAPVSSILFHVESDDVAAIRG